MIVGYFGNADDDGRATADFAVACVEQNERDHAAFTVAISDGRIPAHE